MSEDATADTPAPGVVVHQPRRGFRYGSEAFWLVGFALEAGPVSTALDLGTGSGVMAMLLARLGVRVEGIDVRPEWAPLWRRTLADSVGLPVTLRTADVGAAVGPVDLVVSNPPFFPRGSGPVAADPWRSAARTESSATLARFVEVAIGALAPTGRACMVVPREREDEVLAAAGGRVRRVVRVGQRRALVEMVHGSTDAARTVEVGEGDPIVAAWFATARASR